MLMFDDSVAVRVSGIVYTILNIFRETNMLELMIAYNCKHINHTEKSKNFKSFGCEKIYEKSPKY